MLTIHLLFSIINVVYVGTFVGNIMDANISDKVSPLIYNTDPKYKKSWKHDYSFQIQSNYCVECIFSLCCMNFFLLFRLGILSESVGKGGSQFDFVLVQQSIHVSLTKS
jgi:hypothetical protein